VASLRQQQNPGGGERDEHEQERHLKATGLRRKTGGVGRRRDLRVPGHEQLRHDAEDQGTERLERVA